MSAVGFAGLAGTTTKTVTRYLAAWERAADAGVVPRPSTLAPADWDDVSKLADVSDARWSTYIDWMQGRRTSTPLTIGEQLANDPALAEAAAKALADLQVTDQGDDDEADDREVTCQPIPAVAAPTRTLTVVPASTPSPQQPSGPRRRLPWPAGTCASPRPQDEYPQRITAAVRELDKLVDMVMVTGLPTDPEVRKALDDAVVLIGNGEHNLRAVIHNQEVQAQAVAP